MTSIHEVRAQDGNHVHSVGGREARAEGEELLAESQERVARAGGASDRYWIEEIPTDGLFQVPPSPAPRGRFTKVIYADGSVTAPAGRGRLVRSDRTRPL